MDRAIPVSNRLLSRRWEEITDVLHQHKLRTMRPRVDTASPPAFSLAVRKAKKDQLLEDHYTEIERENRLLLEKMTSIMQGKAAPRPKPTRKRSLNQDFRRREIIKIAQENQALLRRLQDRTATYSTYRWESERKKTEKLLRNICAFPYQLGVTAQGEEGRRRFGSMDPRMTPKPDFARGPKPISTALGERPRRLVPMRNDSELVFKRGVNLNDRYFLVEIRKGPESLMISAFDIESPESYNLELGLKEASVLMEGRWSYEKLVELLVFEKGELMLLEERRPNAAHRRSRGGKKSASPKSKTPHLEARPEEAEPPNTAGFSPKAEDGSFLRPALDDKLEASPAMAASSEALRLES